MWAYTSHLLLGLGLAGLLVGGLTVGLYPRLYDHIMKKQMEIRPGSFAYEMWKDLTIPMYMKVFYFNCTNPDDVIERGEKPLLKQVGPYTFLEHHLKTNISFNHDNATVDFYQIKTWHFQPDMSNGTLDDEIYTVNIIALAAAESTRWPNAVVENDFPFIRFMMNQAFAQNKDQFFMKSRVGNLTFDGIDSPLLHMGEDTMLSGAINIPFDRFGWFYGRNGSAEYDGIFQMYTGTDDIQKVGQISAWNGEPDLERFFPAPCSLLSGSAGEFFPQHRDKTSVSFFTTDLCRPIYFNFKEETEVEGVKGYKYWLDSNFIGNSTVNASNACYNPHPDLVQTPVDLATGTLMEDVRPLEGAINIGLINGLLNVSSCKFDAPAYVSFPHFYNADTLTLDAFHPDSDLWPNEEQHASHLSLMPEQGIPLEVAIRLQINILVRPLEYIEILENIPTMIYPMIWFETSTELPADMAAQLRLLSVVPEFGKIFGYSGIGIAVVLLASGGFMFFRRRGLVAV